jgi:hypothetical protein
MGLGEVCPPLIGFLARERQPTTLASPARLVDHGRARVYPEYVAVPSDQLRNLEHVGAHSAAEIEDAFATTQLKPS